MACTAAIKFALLAFGRVVFGDVDLLPAIGSDIDLLGIVDRQRRRIPAQITQLPQRSQEKPIVTICHLRRVVYRCDFTDARRNPMASRFCRPPFIFC